LAKVYLQGLLMDGGRKSIEPLAERIAGADVQSLRQFVGQSPRAVEQIQQRLAEKVVDLMAEPEVWTIDETSFPKAGEASVGVAREYCGALGKVASCPDGKTVPQTMRSAAIGQAGALDGHREGAFHGLTGDRTIGEQGAGKQPISGPVKAPIGAQLLQQTRRKQRMPVLFAFALNDTNLVPITEEVSEAELTGLADPQSGRIHRHEQGAMFAIELRTAQQLLQFLDT
jgi:hypothetical protein